MYLHLAIRRSHFGFGDLGCGVWARGSGFYIDISWGFREGAGGALLGEGNVLRGGVVESLVV